MPKVFYNPYSWSQVANVIYLEQPKGVGFSYCTQGSEGCQNTDESTAMDSYEALVGFFDEKFPEYKDSEFYITGESYAGTYIPMIMDVADKRGGLPNLKGSCDDYHVFHCCQPHSGALASHACSSHPPICDITVHVWSGAMIGNGCYGNSIGLCGNSHYEKRVDAEIFSGHSMIPLTLYLLPPPPGNRHQLLILYMCFCCITGCIYTYSWAKPNVMYSSGCSARPPEAASHMCGCVLTYTHSSVAGVHVSFRLSLSFRYRHSQIAAACPSNFSDTKPSLKCTELYRQMQRDLGSFNVYNIYDQCPSSDHLLSAAQLLGDTDGSDGDCAAAAAAAAAKHRKQTQESARDSTTGTSNGYQ